MFFVIRFDNHKVITKIKAQTLTSKLREMWCIWLDRMMLHLVVAKFERDHIFCRRPCVWFVQSLYAGYAGTPALPTKSAKKLQIRPDKQLYYLQQLYYLSHKRTNQLIKQVSLTETVLYFQPKQFAWNMPMITFKAAVCSWKSQA